MDKTAEDFERLRNALKRERADRKHHQIRADGSEKMLLKLLPRVEALEAARQAPSLAPVLSGLAEIRRDVEAQLQALQAEIDDLATTLAQIMRQP